MCVKMILKQNFYSNDRVSLSLCSMCRFRLKLALDITQNITLISLSETL